MDEQKELAKFFHDHRGDPDEWEVDEGEPEGNPQPRRAYGVGLTATVTVRFSPEDTEAMRRVAKENGLTYSGLVREAVRAYTKPMVSPLATSATFSLSPHPGAPYPQGQRNFHQPGSGETHLTEASAYLIAAD